MRIINEPFHPMCVNLHQFRPHLSCWASAAMKEETACWRNEDMRDRFLWDGLPKTDTGSLEFVTNAA